MNKYCLLKKIIVILLTGLLYISNNCYAQIYSNTEYGFSMCLPDDFIFYNFNDLPNGFAIIAYNPSTGANMNINFIPANEVDAYGPGITDDRLNMLKNILKNSLHNNMGSIFYDEGEVPIIPNHKAIYVLHKSSVNGQVFDMLSAQFYAHNRTCSITFTQKEGQNRMQEFITLLQTFDCKYNH